MTHINLSVSFAICDADWAGRESLTVCVALMVLLLPLFLCNSSNIDRSSTSTDDPFVLIVKRIFGWNYPIFMMIHGANFDRFQLKPKSAYNYDWIFLSVRAPCVRVCYISQSAINRSIIENGFWSNPFGIQLVGWLAVWQNIVNDPNVIEVGRNYLLISSLIQRAPIDSVNPIDCRRNSVCAIVDDSV